MQLGLVLPGTKAMKGSSQSSVVPAAYAFAPLIGTLLPVPPQAGLTALHWAAAAGGTAVVAELLSLGAGVKAKSKVCTSRTAALLPARATAHGCFHGPWATPAHCVAGQGLFL